MHNFSFEFFISAVLDTEVLWQTLLSSFAILKSFLIYRIMDKLLFA